jgi:hypothetical protein
MSDDARYLVYASDLNTIPNSGAFPSVKLHDSCIGAAPGCVPSDVVIATNCNNASLTSASISGDGQYVTYFCRTPFETNLYIQPTCIGGGGCSSIPMQIGTSYSQTQIVSNGGRYVAFMQQNPVIDGTQAGEVMVMVHDTCNGGPSGCVPKTVPVCVNSSGEFASQHCLLDGMSADGKYILFHTSAPNFSTFAEKSPSYVAVNPLF